jgi:1-acyl-sn-glycerol-3-phosphate acyltransferase
MSRGRGYRIKNRFGYFFDKYAKIKVQTNMDLSTAEVSDANVLADVLFENSDKKQKFLKYFAGFTQFLSWPLISIIFHLFFKLKINDPGNIRKADSPFIVISNHVSFYDSFVFRLVLGAFAKNLPLRFMAVDRFKYWYLNLLSTLFITNFVYALFGVFVIVKGRGIEKNLEESLKIINNRGNVVLYPEGSIIRDKNIASFKAGAATLAKKTNVKVIPVSMKINGNSFRKDFVINVGEPVSYDKNSSIEEITAIFRNTIIDLHKK